MMSINSISHAHHDDESKRKKSDNYTPRQSQGQPNLPNRALRFGRRYMRLIAFAALLVFAFRYFQTRTPGATPRERHLNQHGAMRHSMWPGWSGIKTIVAFGDSHTDTGFDLDGFQPNPKNPIGNPSWPGRTANYGPNYLGHMTSTFNESYIETYNFASWGSYLQQRENPNFIPGPVLMKQVDEIFGLRYGPTSNKWSGDSTLFVFYAGLDDAVFDFYTRGKANAPRDVRSVQRNINTYIASLERIHELGGRNFIVLGLPALEESPRLRTSGIEKSFNKFGAELVDLNGRLAFAVNSFAHEHLDATIFFVDTIKMAVAVRVNPRNYPETSGLKKMEGFCYPYADRNKEVIQFDAICQHDLSEYHWKDEEHQTEPWHRLLGRLCVEQMKDISNALPLVFY